MAVLLAGERAQTRLELGDRRRVTRRGETVADALVGAGLTQRALLQEPGDRKADERDPAGDQEDRAQRRRVPRDIRIADPRWEGVDLARAEARRDGRSGAGGQVVREVRG